MDILTLDDGVGLNVEADGAADKPVLLLGHALGASLRMWDRQVAAFADRFRIVRYDQRGHGHSDLPPGPATVERLGQDALAVLDGVKADTAYYCGLSLGGLVGFWLGLNASDRIRRLVIADALPRIGTRGLWEERIADVTANGVESLAEATMARWFTPAFRDREAATVADVRAMVTATADFGYAAAAAAIRDGDLAGMVEGIAVPVLLITGEHDPLAPPDAVRTVAGRIAGAQMAVIADAGHMPNIEQTAEFNRLVAEFLGA